MSVIVCGDVLAVLRGLPDEQFHCCVTSPPYWGLRDYGMAGQIGLEKTPEDYVSRLVDVFREVRRVLRDDGTLWLNLGDSYTSGGRDYRDAGQSEYNGGNDGAYRGLQEKGKRAGTPAGLKPKDLVGIPWRVAFALQADGWYLRSDIIWHKPNAMPESVTDRPTKAHEYLFLLAKSEKYFYDADAIAEPIAASQIGRVRADMVGGASHEQRGQYSVGSVYTGPRSYNGSTFTRGKTASAREHLAPIGQGDRADKELRNKRSVWTIATQPYPEAHFATFPEDLVRPCILAGCPPGGRVLDPFCGSGTTLAVAAALQCAGVGIELNPEYVKLAEKRLAQDVLPLTEATA